MPSFEKLKVSEAPKPAASLQWERLQAYAGFIQELGPDDAGKLEPEGDEKAKGIKAGLQRAARILGMKLDIWKVEGAFFFKLSSEDQGKTVDEGRRRRSSRISDDRGSGRGHGRRRREGRHA